MTTTIPNNNNTWNNHIEYGGITDNLGDLPSGWELGLAPNGNPFFIDHNNKITTWIDPRTKPLRYTKLSDCTPGDLPYGWQEFNTIDGSYHNHITYFIDHINKKVTLCNPTLTPTSIHYIPSFMDMSTYEQKLLYKLSIHDYWMDQVRSIESQYIHECKSIPTVNNNIIQVQPILSSHNTTNNNANNIISKRRHRFSKKRKYRNTSKHTYYTTTTTPTNTYINMNNNNNNDYIPKHNLVIPSHHYHHDSINIVVPHHINQHQVVHDNKLN